MPTCGSLIYTQSLIHTDTVIYTEVVIVWWYTHRVRYAVPAPLKDCHFNRLSAITKLQIQPTNQILPHSQHFPPSATKFVPKSVSVLRSARWRENDGRKGESLRFEMWTTFSSLIYLVGQARTSPIFLAFLSFYLFDQPRTSPIFLAFLSFYLFGQASKDITNQNLALTLDKRCDWFEN